MHCYFSDALTIAKEWTKVAIERSFVTAEQQGLPRPRPGSPGGFGTRGRCSLARKRACSAGAPKAAEGRAASPGERTRCLPGGFGGDR